MREDSTIIDAHSMPYTWPIERDMIAAKNKRKKRGNIQTTSRGISEFIPKLFSQNPVDKSAELIREMKENKVDLAIITSCMLHVPNDFLAKIVDNHREKLIGFGLWPHKKYNFFDPYEAAEEIKRAINTLGFRGVGEWSMKNMYPIPPHEIHRKKKCIVPMDTIAKLGVPVLFHTGWTPFPCPMRYGDPLIIDDIATYYPDVPMILAHAGKRDSYFHEKALLVAKQHDNVYLELSHQRKNDIERIVKKIGADRCMFGTNWWPAEHSAWREGLYHSRIEPFTEAKISQDDRTQLLGGTIKGILSL